MSPTPIPSITHDQIKAARKLLGWSAATLAIRSHRTVAGVGRAETGTLKPQYAEASLTKIRATLEAAGIEFTNEGKPGVKLRENP